MARLLITIAAICFGTSAYAVETDVMTPVQVAQLVARMDTTSHNTTSGASWAREPAYSRFFSRSFRADRDKMWSQSGNWLDADELTGRQDTDGIIITEVKSITYPTASMSIVAVEYLQHKGPFKADGNPIYSGSFLLMREDGVWKIDEFATTYPDDPKPFRSHANYRKTVDGDCDATTCKSPSWMFRAFDNAISACKNDDDADKQQIACAIMKPIAEKLYSHGYCYGHRGQAGFEMEWEPCGPASIKLAR